MSQSISTTNLVIKCLKKAYLLKSTFVAGKKGILRQIMVLKDIKSEDEQFPKQIQ